MRFTEESFPGWVECTLQDTSGREWQFTEKIPVLTKVDLRPGSGLPQQGLIACRLICEWTDGEGRRRCLISTENPWNIEASGGETKFEVFADQIETDGH